MVRFIGFVSVILLLTSCNNKLAKRCAETYPCKDSTITKEIEVHDSIPYIEFEKVPYPDRVYVWTDAGMPRFDSLPDSIRYVFKPVIKYKYITRKGVEKIIRVRDTAKEKVLQDQIDELQNQLQKSESKPEVKMPWWIAIIVALFGYGLYRGTKKQQ